MNPTTLPIRPVLALVALVGACTLQGGRTTDLGDDREAGSDSGGSRSGSVNARGGNASMPKGGARNGSAGELARGQGGTTVAAGSAPIPMNDAAGDSAGGAAPEDDGSTTGFAEAKNEYGFALADSFFLTGCGEVQEHQCKTVPGECPNVAAPNFEDKGERFEETFKMKGTPGKTYLVTLAINGVVEGKYYQAGARRDGNNFDLYAETGQDLFYSGGEPIPSRYRVYKLSVFEPDGVTPVGHYYLNSVPQQFGGESHTTFVIGYQATIEVPGRGVIRYLNQDSVCYAINNCGPGDNGVNTCAAPRAVPNEPGLVLPSMFGGRAVSEMNVVNGAAQPFHAQIIHVRVTDVKLKR